MFDVLGVIGCIFEADLGLRCRVECVICGWFGG